MSFSTVFCIAVFAAIMIFTPLPWYAAIVLTGMVMWFFGIGDR